MNSIDEVNHMSLQECFELFLQTKQTRCRPQTVKFYAWLCQQVGLLAEAAGHLNGPVGDISRAVLEKWVISLYDRVAAGDIRDTTVKKIVKFLKQFFAYLADEGFIETNPAVKLKCRTAHPIETRPFTADELTRLFEFEPRKPVEFRDEAFWLLLLDTGARCQEAALLQLTDWVESRKQRYRPMLLIIEECARRHPDSFAPETTLTPVETASGFAPGVSYLRANMFALT